MQQESTVVETRVFPSVSIGFELGSKAGICHPEAAAVVCVGRIYHTSCRRSILEEKTQQL